MRRMFTRSVASALVAVLTASLFVLVTANVAHAEQVSDEAGFRDAFNNETTVELLNNITLGCTDGDGTGAAVRNASGADVLVDGGGFTITQTCPNSAVLENDSQGQLTLNNVTITGGTAGGVLSATNVFLNNSLLIQNTGGGSLDTSAGANLNQSRITQGEYAIEASGQIIMNSSTVDHNNVPIGVGVSAVIVTPNTISLTNSTVTNNSAFEGAIYSGLGVTLTFSTVVENENTGFCEFSARFGAAVIPTIACNLDGANVNTGGANHPLNSRGSVIALPLGGAPNCSIDGSTLGDYNFTDDQSCNLSNTHDILDGNPQLGALGNNGGPTPTRLPVTGSPLIDQVPFGAFPCGAPTARIGLAGFLVDQRGISRPQGPSCDIGAVEVVPGNPNELPSVTVTASPDTAVEGGVPGKFTFTRQGDTSFDMGVAYDVGGTATSGTDYTPLGSVTIPAGQASASIPVDALADNVSDPGETVSVQITMGPNYTIGSPSTSTVTILEDFCASAPQADYPDRETFDVHAHAIDCITAYGMAEGFDDGTYGATLPVSRAQMASFLARLIRDCGVTTPANPPDAYPGDNGDVHEQDINQLAALGVLDDTTGQTGDKYNVSDPMRRDDMAQLLYNAYKLIIGEPLADGPDAFTDDSASDNQQAINALANAGVVEGTGGGLYDPSGPVSRGQMASFFVRFMQLLFDAGKLPPLP